MGLGSKDSPGRIYPHAPLQVRKNSSYRTVLYCRVVYVVMYTVTYMEMYMRVHFVTEALEAFFGNRENCTTVKWS